MTSLNIHQVVESGELTMTSLEVSEVTKVRHPDVLRKIRELSGKGIIRSFEQIAQKHDSTKKGGRPMKLCRLNKTESINLVANLCPEFTARIVDRWIELEQKEAGLSPYSQLQNLALQIKVSEQIGKIGSGLMHKRKEDKKLLKAVEKQLAAHCQLIIKFNFCIE
ncbi:Rha family transcriptional regulator [Endozoicomonas gorgoniicola]|uniref:Rha family transcriptional regulator n=1 Tax=Endozoicomonas gorgoniicola TaxID=1234144 RepID=A0ABT3MRV7_9GAMM|nr:Rha family transcriptional regulator [Endozoicomonas gorgoniicola]MCW7552105.1 Rha family transcriptional regulator [Endozoicomonas gorgoniicola]